VPSPALILAGLSLFIWVLLTFFRGAFWQLRAFDDDVARHESPPSWPRVVAIAPARNEAETICRSVESLIAQDYPGEFHVIIVDDHSEDATAALAHRAAEASGAAGRVTVMQAEPLPPGWTGKLWALEQGVGEAAAFSPEYLWLTDADILHAPDTARRLVARAESQGLEMVSLMVLWHVRTFSERLLIPPFIYFFLKLYPPRWIADAKSRMAGAAGGCILLQKRALDRIGGIAAVRGEVIDDCALARAVKGSGGKLWMGLTRKSVSLREYATFREIRDLIARTAFTQLEYSTPILLGTVAAMVLTYLVPVALMFHTQTLVWRMSLAAWALMTITYLPTVRLNGLSPLWAPLLPAAAAFYTYATCLSAVRYWLGRGGQWKGRAQAPAKR
jgi:hopene-associated glycosyltransferase HpnB